MSTDKRSIGELLVANDLLAREVLMDTDQLHAREVIRAWPALRDGAEAFWSALPNPDAHPGPRPDEHLIRHTLDLNGLRSKGLWPSAGRSDTRLIAMAGNFERAAMLLHRFNRVEGHKLAAPVVRDLEAAETRALHSLYLVAHGASVALAHEHEKYQHPVVRQHRTPGSPEAVPKVVVSLRQQLAGVEQALGLHLGRRWPTALEGEHREAPDASRLREALAAWDVQAHRAMSESPSASTALIVCHTQAVVIGNGHALVRAAALREQVDPLEYRDRLAPSLETTAANFRAAGEVWRHMARAGEGLDKDLRVASGEVVAAAREIVRDGAMLASPDVLAQRVDLAQAGRTMQHALISSATLGQAVKELAADPNLSGPARWVHEEAIKAQTRLHAADALSRQHASYVEPSPMNAWVNPNALRRNADVPLPPVLRESISGQMERLAQSAVAGRDVAGGALGRHPQLTGREIEGRGLPVPDAPTSLFFGR
ncbi:hypothetical protein ACRTEC_16250 [Janibacter indicus]